jgi:hypothetical protein
MAVDGTTYFVLVSVAVFSGAVVSGLAGFAFSAVAGAILLHLMPPIEAVPLMMACSILVQVTSLFALMRGVQWKRSLILSGGGLIGIVPRSICCNRWIRGYSGSASASLCLDMPHTCCGGPRRGAGRAPAARSGKR